MRSTRQRRLLGLSFILLLALILGIGAGIFSRHVFSQNARFEAFTNSLFIQEVSGNTLNLHYTLAHPENYQINPRTVTLGQVSPDNREKATEALTKYKNTLEKFPYEKLSRENRLTYDMLLLYFETELSLGENYLLEEVLGPSLGIQSQLPVLLAEYAFYDEQDILDYLQLLTCMEPYFQSILDFEREKAQAGYFMSDTTLERIVEQCSAFVTTCEDNYLTEIFQEKLSAFQDFSPQKREKYLSVHNQILTSHVFPAYQTLIEGLKDLKGSGKNPYGLAYFDHGKEYYQYLLQSQSGLYITPEEVKERLYQQLLSDSAAISRLLTADASLAERFSQDIESFEPVSALLSLEKRYQEDFPPLEHVSYDVKYVHKSLEKFSSPAFYLTPPIDTNAPNTIYINQSSQTSNLELFTTLAHEGFPGHLYQTIYFSRTKPQDIRHLFSFGGYVEGWATYVESYAYGYSGIDANLAELCWRNRSINLCIYSLLDVGIHYYGWTPKEAGQFLSSFGIRNPAILQEIYQYIVETPGNYLKYYMGYLNFLDLKTEMQKKEASAFSLTAFHEKILNIGPVQFPVLRKYLLEES